jgi:hypothetical protein
VVGVFDAAAISIAGGTCLAVCHQPTIVGLIFGGFAAVGRRLRRWWLPISYGYRRRSCLR